MRSLVNKRIRSLLRSDLLIACGKQLILRNAESKDTLSLIRLVMAKRSFKIIGDIVAVRIIV